MKQKFNQNGFGVYNGLKWKSTNNTVFVFTDKGMKSARVQRVQDFDFEALFNIAANVGEK